MTQEMEHTDLPTAREGTTTSENNLIKAPTRMVKMRLISY